MKVVINEIGETDSAIVTKYSREGVNSYIQFADFRFNEDVKAADFTIQFVKNEDSLHFGIDLESLEIIVDFYRNLFDDEGNFLSSEQLLS